MIGYKCKGRKVLSLVLLIARLVLQLPKPSFFYLKTNAIIPLLFCQDCLPLSNDGRPPKTHEDNHHRDHHFRTPRGYIPVITGAGKHTFPSRTRPLRPQPPMVVQPRCCARVGCRRVYQPLSLIAKRLTFFQGWCSSGTSPNQKAADISVGGFVLLGKGQSPSL